jgi:hypothetical protein
MTLSLLKKHIMFYMYFLYIFFIFPCESIAEKLDAVFYENLEKKVWQIRDLVAKKNDDDIAKVFDYIDSNIGDNPDAYVTYSHQLIIMCNNSGGCHDKNIRHLCMKMFNKSIVMDVDLLPYRLGQQIDLLHWEQQILKQDNDSSDILFQKRKEKVNNILCRWQKIISYIDDTWDESDTTQIYDAVKIPWNAFKSGIVRSGMMFPPAEAIEDKEIRKRYQAEIDGAQKLLKRANQQQQAKKVRKEKSDVVKQYIINLYSIPPSATEELATLLKEYNIDEEFSQEILDTVKKQVKSK